jgi:hypothetical protein
LLTTNVSTLVIFTTLLRCVSASSLHQSDPRHALAMSLCGYTRVVSRALCSPPVKNIRLSRHALSQLAFRGSTEDEVRATISSAERHPAERGRLECRRDYIFNKTWNNRYYAMKQVRPIFVDEPDEIGVVTVYVYYS